MRFLARIKEYDAAKLGFALVVSIYALICASSPSTYRFLDNVDLVFHEAGHLFLTPFGQFAHMIGGTLGQLVFPVAATATFYVKQQLYSASVVMFWVGQNFFNISVYMRDAIKTELPLLGGEDMIHDWHWIFRRLDMLDSCYVIGNCVYGVGLTCVVISVYGMFKYAHKKAEEPKLPN